MPQGEFDTFQDENFLFCIYLQSPGIVFEASYAFIFINRFNNFCFQEKHFDSEFRAGAC